MEFGNQPMLLGTLIHNSNMVDTTISLKPSSGRNFPSRAHVLPSDSDSSENLYRTLVAFLSSGPLVTHTGHHLFGLGESLGSCLGPILGNHVVDVDQPLGSDPFLLGPTIEHIIGTGQQGVDSNFVHGWSCKTSSKRRIAKCTASVFPPDLTPAKRRMHVAPFGDDLPTQKRIRCHTGPSTMNSSVEVATVQPHRSQ
ncbi:hypothetical protein Pyn_16729 [Prunus yedoensis var. nudiflora]|uniref:Uncharacterized protein n=1 Tax=Prunus yedoensis var. nudiflora TaxID=2094558 RepID=A0A314U7U3_PRUYE|nr:hypothetical protein Pyn_16729 [Prunus yedoensis var. nudiflora]